MRWFGSFRRARTKDIADEIGTHLEMATRDRIDRVAPEEARADAMREFGNVALVTQTTREVWSWTVVEQLLQDLRFGARILWHAPGLSATALTLIALVIGGNTTIYSMVNSLVVSPAPGVTAARLVALRHVEPGNALPDPFTSFPNYEHYARSATTVRGLAGWSTERLTLGMDTGNYALYGGLVTPNYFDTFGVAIVRGRPLRAEDDAAREGLAAVISSRVWRDRFGEAADVVGRKVTINRVLATVVGVAAPGFSGVTITPGEDVWLPIRAYYHAIGSAETLSARRQPLVAIAGQLAPSASLEDAQAEFATRATQLHASFPDAFTTYTTRGVTQMRNPHAEILRYSGAALLPVGQMAPRFLAVFSVVTVLTLLVVSANVANLMLGRAVERQRDTAVRQSLGASRARIVRMLFAEGATLAIAAWAVACVFAWWTCRLVLQFIEPRPGLLAAARPDWTLAAYAMALALLATLAFSIAPGIRTWRMQILPLLRAGEHGVARGRSRVAGALVVSQFAFSVLLVTSAGLAYRSMSMLDSGDVGFETDHLLLVTVRARQTGAFISGKPAPADQAARFALLERVRERLTAAGDIDAATYARRVPGAYFLETTAIRREGITGDVDAFVRQVGPDYLRVLGLTPIAGRELTTADRRGARRTAVINRQLASQLFPDTSPLGHIALVGDRREPVEIVGVAPDARFDGPVHDPRPRYVFIAEQQLPAITETDPTFFIRHRGTVDAVTPLVGRAIAEAEPSLPIVSMSTMNARLETVTSIERMITQLLGAFAVMSLVVASLGQYAVAMFNMRRRTRDFGVRLALGASSTQIQQAVVREALQLTIPGVAIGFALSMGIATVFRTALFGVTPTDPPTYVGVFLLLSLTSVLASYLPAWRAGRVNVMDALRQE
jgi:predicted permease